ncbi:MAG: PspC family transcriptional regulator [Tenericutes bacterium HGW-Tenericutes-1]|jgi:phage shock protein PspC (stress-responsive transcriptional regulator)|nr:MAG: PspC family transcriptional regulator [Tenericutes bacterium HGW-Tenericutes-3]PKL01139.1 MAG: PspC family transcriptional regulator [Tenericutes bacterium HGW-Tenericutes-1]
MSNNNTRKLYRDTDNQKIFGVCSGLADYLEADVTLIRVIWVLLVFLAGTGVLAYIIMAIVMEPKSVVLKKEKVVNDNDDPFAKYDK